MAATRKKSRGPRSKVRTKLQRTSAKPEKWDLRLYVAGQTPRCVEAFAQLERICEEHLQGRYTIEVIDLLENPTLAAGDQIIAIPTLVRKLPTPMKKIIGDLCNAERVIVGLNLTQHGRRARGSAA